MSEFEGVRNLSCELALASATVAQPFSTFLKLQQWQCCWLSSIRPPATLGMVFQRPATDFQQSTAVRQYFQSFWNGYWWTDLKYCQWVHISKSCGALFNHFVCQSTVSHTQLFLTQPDCTFLLSIWMGTTQHQSWTPSRYRVPLSRDETWLDWLGYKY